MLSGKQAYFYRIQMIRTVNTILRDIKVFFPSVYLHKPESLLMTGKNPRQKLLFRFRISSSFINLNFPF